MTTRKPSPSKRNGTNLNITPTAPQKIVGGETPALAQVDAVALPRASDIKMTKPIGEEIAPTPRHLLDEDNKLPVFKTSTLSQAEINRIIAEQLNGGFFRTEAGYVSLAAGLDYNGQVVISLNHWKSMNFPEQDEEIRTVVSVGTITKSLVRS